MCFVGGKLIVRVLREIVDQLSGDLDTLRGSRLLKVLANSLRGDPHPLPPGLSKKEKVLRCPARSGIAHDKSTIVMIPDRFRTEFSSGCSIRYHERRRHGLLGSGCVPCGRVASAEAKGISFTQQLRPAAKGE